MAMTLEDLKAEWARDCEIDNEDLGGAAIRSAILHSKYIDNLIEYKLKYSKYQLDLAQLRAVKAKYFRGELTSEELRERGWEQWQYRTLKGDIDGLLEADADMQKMIAREQYVKTIIYFLESVLTEIKNRSFNIRAALDWMKFRAGG